MLEAGWFDTNDLRSDVVVYSFYSWIVWIKIITFRKTCHVLVSFPLKVVSKLRWRLMYCALVFSDCGRAGVEEGGEGSSDWEWTTWFGTDGSFAGGPGAAPPPCPQLGPPPAGFQQSQAQPEPSAGGRTITGRLHGSQPFWFFLCFMCCTQRRACLTHSDLWVDELGNETSHFQKSPPNIMVPVPIHTRHLNDTKIPYCINCRERFFSQLFCLSIFKHMGPSSVFYWAPVARRGPCAQSHVGQLIGVVFLRVIYFWLIDQN